MAAETFVTALLLITAIISAGILINAVYPVVWNMAGTFSSASHETDTRMRTDFKIVATYANNTGPSGGGWAKIWMKNIGSSRIGLAEIDKSDVIVGVVGNMNKATLDINNWEPISDNTWNYQLTDYNSNGYWESGETLEVVAFNSQFNPPAGQDVYFQFILPNGVWRSSEFTTS
ncbi:MAG: flagellin [Methanoregula sp.]|nr:flagellin [Methanoregula sp.]